MWIFFLLAIVVLFAVVGVRNANHNYTIGKGMYKNSPDNTDQQRYTDAADFDYYNTTDKLQ